MNYSWLDTEAQRRAERAARALVAAVPATEDPIRPGGALPDIISRRGHCKRSGIVDVVGCASGHRFWRDRPCDRIRCKACRGSVARRRARRSYDKWGGKGILVLVLTWPGTWRHVAGPLHLLAFRAEVRILIRAWLEGELNGAMGAKEFWHPAGEHARARGGGVTEEQDDPRGPESQALHPHLNYLIPLGLVREGRAVPLQWPGHGPGWVPRDALDRLRARLQGLLDRLSGAWGLPQAMANLFCEYRTHPAKVRHALTYFSRPWPSWGDAMASIGVGAEMGLLSGASARSRAEDRAAWLAYLTPPEEAEEAEKCPQCGLDLAALCALGRGLADDLDPTPVGADPPRPRKDGKLKSLVPTWVPLPAHVAAWVDRWGNVVPPVTECQGEDWQQVEDDI